MILVDGHLDIAFNARCFGRDPRRSALETRRLEANLDSKWRGQCMVGLPEMRRARVALVFSTLFLMRRGDWDSGRSAPPGIEYADEREAERLALDQLAFYEQLASDPDEFVLIGDLRDLDRLLERWEGDRVGPVGLLPLMEGADPIRRPEDVTEWFDRGLRIVGLAWKSTRYSGGTGEPGPLTDPGRELVDQISRNGMILDLSHTSEEAFHEALDLTAGPVIASHSNPRAMKDTDRQLSDEMVRKLSARGGIVGIVPCSWMLVPDWSESAPAVPLERVAQAMRHVADLAGTHETVAIGSDFDGGFGAEVTPEGLETIGDLPRLADVLSDHGFSDEMIFDVLGGNWIRFLRGALPPGDV